MGDEIREINISGGNVGIGRHAIGLNQPVQSPQSVEIQQLLNALRHEVEAHSGELADPDAVRGPAAVVGEELEKEEPNFRTVHTLLRSMTGAAGQVASLAQVVTQLEQAVRGMF